MGYGLRVICKGGAKVVNSGEYCKGGGAITDEFVRNPYAAWLLPASPALPSLICHPLFGQMIL